LPPESAVAIAVARDEESTWKALACLSCVTQVVCSFLRIRETLGSAGRMFPWHAAHVPAPTGRFGWSTRASFGVGAFDAFGVGSGASTRAPV
jgi:hypothetical protein